MPGKKREPNEIRVVNEKPREYVTSFASNPLRLCRYIHPRRPPGFAVFYGAPRAINHLSRKNLARAR